MGLKATVPSLVQSKLGAKDEKEEKEKYDRGSRDAQKPLHFTIFQFEPSIHMQQEEAST
jgi:hypothetical protein